MVFVLLRKRPTLRSRQRMTVTVVFLADVIEHVVVVVVATETRVVVVGGPITVHLNRVQIVEMSSTKLRTVAEEDVDSNEQGVTIEEEQ